MHNTELFWKWFTDNSDRLTMLNDLSENEQQELLEQLQEQLTDYCEGLSFEISEPMQSGRVLTFSAEGDVELFQYVVQLVDDAPDFDWWEFVPFKQSKGTQLKVYFDKYLFETSKMYFMHLENEEEPDVLGVRVALEKPDTDDDQLVGVYVTLEAMIGEFDCATLVGYLDTCAIPANPEEEGFRPLDEFPEFVEWFKAQRDEE